MEALIFGSSQRPLFGLRHAPSCAVRRQTAILICPPWGPEYMRAYRGLRLLATRLAAAGYDTLRFDYSGTGDSEGMALDSRVEHWLDDIASAAQELRDLSAAPRLAVLGLRLGGLLAQAASARGLAFDAQMLWDCPTDGASFVAQMHTLEAALEQIKSSRRGRDAQLPAPADDELCGHAWPATLARGVAVLPAVASHPRQLWLSSSDLPDSPTPPGASCWQAPDASHWLQPYWYSAPWQPVPSFHAYAEFLHTWLP